MKVLKWGSVFLISFALSWIIIITFTQDEFVQNYAPVILFNRLTPEFPVYVFSIGSFLIGLLIGGIIAVYNYLSMQTALFKKNHEIKVLKNKLEELTAQHEEDDRQAAENTHEKLGELDNEEPLMNDGIDEDETHI